MEIVMPYLDGIGATQCIRKACPQTIVIGLTGHFSPPTYTAMRTAGAAAFVCKNQLLSIHETIMTALGKDIEWD
jgi:DNA-binding NarL/FixJ family response regulator